MSADSARVIGCAWPVDDRRGESEPKLCGLLGGQHCIGHPAVLVLAVALSRHHPQVAGLLPIAGGHYDRLIGGVVFDPQRPVFDLAVIQQAIVGW